VRLPSGSSLRVRFGERVEHDGRRAPLAAPSALWGAAATAESALRTWRTKRAQADGVPAYIVVNDKHLRGIALARPTSPAELVACDGIGPTKLERYGDEILEVLADLAG
jgi:superfamily II DNA helicase RecQ